MSDAAVIFLLTVCTAVLTGIVCCQRFAYRKGMQNSLRKISEKLKEIQDTESGESIQIFTDDKSLMELTSQINRLLENHRKTRADFRQSEIDARKMLSNISHDMKTPMTVILGYLEIMRLGSSEDNVMLRKVEQRAQKLLEMMNEFFSLAKLEAHDVKIEIYRIDACEICRESILDFYELLTDKEIQVEVDIPEEPLDAWGNRDALQRILLNLISNAVRYGLDGRYLGLFLRSDQKYVYIEVTDRGKGIDGMSASHVFDRLFTAEDSRNREIQGNGLGLAIAQNLARQLGGEIFLESEPGKKTTFTVKLRKISSWNTEERNS